MRIRRVRRVTPKPKTRPKLRPKAPVAKARAPVKLVNPYKPKAPITLPPGTKFKPIPPGVRSGPVGGGKPTIKPRKPLMGGGSVVKPKPRVRRKPRVRKAATRRTGGRRAY